MNTPYPHLFAPIKIGPVTLPHRAISVTKPSWN